jgi:hypothetical protein
MPSTIKKKLAKSYARAIIAIAPLYRLISMGRGKRQHESTSKQAVLLISRPQDIELLIGLHDRAMKRKDVKVSFWVVDSCRRRYPEVLEQLQEKGAIVDLFVSYGELATALKKLMQNDIFLSTVESTTAKNKLPYILTRLANILKISTYTLQHGYPNLGLSFCDRIYGPDIGFAAKTVFTWGPVEDLPAWVRDDTRNKCAAVGCPKELVLYQSDLSKEASDRPIIAVFENLHGHIFDKHYVAGFLGDLQEAAKKHTEYRFILKSHPSSLRCRTEQLTELLKNLTDVEIVDRVDEQAPAYTTPWLLANALGAVTTPSTVALDGTLQEVPVALALYGLDIFRPAYSPLTMLESGEDWEVFLGKLNNGDDLKKRNEKFLDRVIVPGDAASRILDFMSTGQQEILPKQNNRQT